MKTCPQIFDMRTQKKATADLST